MDSDPNRQEFYIYKDGIDDFVSLPHRALVAQWRERRSTEPSA